MKPPLPQLSADAGTVAITMQYRLYYSWDRKNFCGANAVLEATTQTAKTQNHSEP
jgi:hypothetical protein